MKKILIILDGIVAKKLLHRIVESNTGDNSYDVIYTNDVILPLTKPNNFTFYKFDPTSNSKLSMVLDKDVHSEVLMALNSKDEMLSTIKIIREYKKNLQITVLDYWGISIKDPMVNVYKGIDVLANGMVERLPNVPVLAQNIGLKQGEIMEIKIPFGSSYAYKSIATLEHKDWRIFGIYRNQKLLELRRSLVIKPNDIILVIGKPSVLMNIYNVIGKTQGQFPMPFGSNIYLYLDLYLECEESLKTVIDGTKYLNEKLKNSLLIVRITRPTTPSIMTFIKENLEESRTIIIHIDYANRGFKELYKEDNRRYNIGLLTPCPSMFKNKKALVDIFEANTPIYKVGLENLRAAKNIAVVLNDYASYEQIAPTVFDLASQLKLKSKVFNHDPIGEKDNQDELLNNYENIAKVFNEKVEIVSGDNNPIRELRQQEYILQVLPLKEKMFRKRSFFKFIYTNSDLVAFDMQKFNQILIPIAQEEKN
ncbi:COG3400 family protein [Arcobacter porcinus]|uniref:TrkA-C domain protein n=1 Tax=Arcobacter porcinus TaxID=1935204 RepID=A0ABX2YB06_9BACT|nr:TrkA C-terminal domain-containing protein [Arcobacter porcinus]OCL84025.1 TrkA-C domain protein [Arcobacter porcinus]OCL84547.1 TrkA-C domain protein [Arcobacter porcinus]OCL89089.1 TrkA-C domain protein [Arcobacter porcinus]OCL91509.1 TrkA-C domain protein [Arcobacter porcinus]